MPSYELIDNEDTKLPGFLLNLLCDEELRIDLAKHFVEDYASFTNDDKSIQFDELATRAMVGVASRIDCKYPTNLTYSPTDICVKYDGRIVVDYKGVKNKIQSLKYMIGEDKNKCVGTVFGVYDNYIDLIACKIKTYEYVYEYTIKNVCKEEDLPSQTLHNLEMLKSCYNRDVDYLSMVAIRYIEKE